jgi:hypothetical protein
LCELAAEEGVKDFMGIYPEILRAYAVVASKLFLWKYEGDAYEQFDLREF